MSVVTHEKPGGSWCTYCIPTSRRKARSPEFRSGIFDLDEVAGQLADEPLRRHPEELDRSFLGAPSSDHLVIAVHRLDESRDLVVRVGHVGVGPDDDAADCGGRPGAASRAGTTVDRMADQPDVLDRGQLDLRAVVRTVVHNDDLVRVGGRVEGGADAVDLGAEMALLVVDRQHDAHVACIGCSWRDHDRPSYGPVGHVPARGRRTGRTMGEWASTRSRVPRFERWRRACC